MRIAIVHKGKCKPSACGSECKKTCPINKKGEECVVVDSSLGKKAEIDEELCIGCGICEKRCPFLAIDIVNLPFINESDLIYRYGENDFALYGLPVPKEKGVLGLLGRNGIGKTTAIEILAGKKEINLGKPKEDEKPDESEIKDFLKKHGLLNYFSNLKSKKISYKPQNLSFLSVELKTIELLKKRAVDISEEKIKKLAEKLGIEHVLDNKLNTLSGGELQKTAILACVLNSFYSKDKSEIYFLDEPLAYLDIEERLKISDFISEIAESGKNVIVVEHDILILDYLADFLNIFYGQQGAYGLVSGVKTSREGVNAYLSGFLKQENLLIREKELNFNFTKNKPVSGRVIAEWPDFYLKFDSGFELKVKSGEIKENHVIGILGKNGTGKTSFIKAIAGLENVEISGKKQKLDLELNISYKPQYLFIDSEERVRDIIIREKINKKVSSMFNLGILEQKKLKELSGGELQRFSIAGCLAKEADIYLIDEPSAYLDVEERILCAKAIKDIMVEKGKTAFVVEHDLLLISYLADSIIVFSGERGKKGESSEVLSFEDGISRLLKELSITLRKDKDSGRPRINKRGSVLDREQKSEGRWAVF